MIAFTRTIPGVYTAATDRWSQSSTLTITGNAIQVRGNPQQYEALGLILSTAPTLLFTPTAYGLKAFTPDFVQPGDYVTWNGLLFTVRDVSPIAPDGIVIAARIIIST